MILPDIESSVGAETTIVKTTIEAASAGTGQRGRPETILLVEDETFVREVTAEVLASAGYKLVIARCAAEALKAFPGCCEPLDLLLADVVMPELSGRQLARELELFYPRIRVLLMSGYAEQLTRCELSLYDEECLAKPFSISTLLRKVREMLDKPVDLKPD